MPDFPRRIACLTEETVETLYLGEHDRIVDPSAVIARNPEVIVASWRGSCTRFQPVVRVCSGRQGSLTRGPDFFHQAGDE
jgi:hypothetical protein